MSRVAREIVEAVVLALIIFMVIQTSIRNFKVDGSSMRPTLEGGQYLLVNKLVYFKVDTERLSRLVPFWKVERPSEHYLVRPPERGDVIVFRFPMDPRKDFVKRVIGLPGEQVELGLGTVYINDVPLEEPYLTAADNSTYPATQLGEKQYFVLGDNRRSSNDSRTWGPLPEENVRGKVWLVYWPLRDLHFMNGVASAAEALLR